MAVRAPVARVPTYLLARRSVRRSCRRPVGAPARDVAAAARRRRPKCRDRGDSPTSTRGTRFEPSIRRTHVERPRHRRHPTGRTSTRATRDSSPRASKPVRWERPGPARRPTRHRGARPTSDRRTRAAHNPPTPRSGYPLARCRKLLGRARPGIESYDSSGMASHHWHHHWAPTRIRSFGCQQYEMSAVGSR